MFAKSKVSQSLIDAVSSITSVDETIKIPTPTGTKVLGRSYGNSAKAHLDQTKKEIDTIKGPKTKELKDIEKPVKEELKGNQDKIDVNHNNKIDSQDFKILRGKKKLKEGNSFSARLINHAMFAEEVEEELNEVLSKDASAGDYIHDFIHSDNPKFAGKSKAERKKMALGAYYGKKNEEWEGSKKDKEEDAEEAKKRGMTKTEWEKSEADKKHDMKESNCAMADGPITTDTLAGRVDGGKPNSFKSFKLRVSPLDKEGDESTKNPSCDEPEDTIARQSIKAKGISPTVHTEEVELDEETPKKNQDVADKSYLKDMGKKPTIKSDLKNFGRFLAGKKETNEEVVDEALKGNQKKIDKNHNNKIDSQDFKILRTQKEEVVDESKGLSPGQDDAPFEPPYTKIPSNIKDKSGAVHTPMSRAKDLARQAMKKVKTEMLGKAPGNNG
jgi:hypothetical protein